MSAWDDIRDGDLSNAHAWSSTAKGMVAAVICIVIIGVGLWFFVKPQYEVLRQAEAEELQLRQTFEQKQKKAANLAAYKEQLAQMRDEYCAMFDQLPTRTEMPNLLTNISQTAQDAGIETELFQPGNEVKKEFYAELPIQLRMQGGYHEIAQFVSQVASLPRIVTLTGGNLSLKPSENAPGQLTLEGTATTYRRIEGDASLCANTEQEPAP